MGIRFRQLIEAALAVLGTAGVMVVASIYVHGLLGSSNANPTFESVANDESDPAPLDVRDTDQNLWLDKRGEELAESDGAALPPARLGVERLQLHQPVFTGMEPVTLDRGAGIAN